MNFKDFFNYFLLREDSVENIELKGDWDAKQQYGWSKADTGILKSPLGLEKIKTKWKIDQPVDIYLVKGKHASKFVELGKVNYDFIRNEMKLDVLPDSDHITIIYTQNTGAEKIPATPWTLAHRFGHALARVNGMGRRNDQYKSIEEAVDRLFETIADEVYGTDISDISERDYFRPKVSQENRKIRKELGHALGAFKSARDRHLRADFEFVNEIIAQYIITGKIKLNRDFPKVLPLRYAWGQPTGKWRKRLTEEDKADLDNYLSNTERELEYHIDDALNAAIGDIFVM
jgi:hypothetical protein